MAHIYNGILFSHKNKWNWVICSEVEGPRVCHTEWSKSEREKQIPYANMVLESIMLSERSQTESEKYHMISHICGI